MHSPPSIPAAFPRSRQPARDRIKASPNEHPTNRTSQTTIILVTMRTKTGMRRTRSGLRTAGPDGMLNKLPSSAMPPLRHRRKRPQARPQLRLQALPLATGMVVSLPACPLTGAARRKPGQPPAKMAANLLVMVAAVAEVMAIPAVMAMAETAMPMIAGTLVAGALRMLTATLTARTATACPPRRKGTRSSLAHPRSMHMSAEVG